MAVFRKSAKFNDHHLKYTHYTLYYIGIQRYVYVVAVDTASPAEVSKEERPVLKYYTFSAKETKQVKGAESDLSQANLA